MKGKREEKHRTQKNHIWKTIRKFEQQKPEKCRKVYKWKRGNRMQSDIGIIYRTEKVIEIVVMMLTHTHTHRDQKTKKKP